MNDKSKFTMPVLYSSIMYLCGLLLFIEWLYPVRDITDTESISIFVLYAVFAFFISMIHMKWWLSFGLKAFGLVFILNGLYFDMLFLSPAWFSQLLTEVVLNINYLGDSKSEENEYFKNKIGILVNRAIEFDTIGEITPMSSFFTTKSLKEVFPELKEIIYSIYYRIREEIAFRA